MPRRRRMLPSDNAETFEERQDVIERIFAAWQRAPDLRLGQLLIEALQDFRPIPCNDYAISIMGDKGLAGIMEAFSLRRRERSGKQP